MPLYDNVLPPGLRGYYAAQAFGDRRNEAQLQTLMGLAQLQHSMEQRAFEQQLNPLRLQQLQSTLDTQARQQQALQNLTAGFGQGQGGGQVTPQQALELPGLPA